MRLLPRRAFRLTNARVVGADGVTANGVRIAGSRIAALDADGPSDVAIDLDNAFVFPGLVNAHDHLALNHFPRLKWRERYQNASEWIADFQPRFTDDPVVVSALSHRLGDRLLIGALKNLLSGVTTVCHHDPMYRELGRGFPVRVVDRFGFSHSLHIDGTKVLDSFQRTRSSHPWIVHAAEGVDAGAAAEIPTLRRLGCIARNTVLVHGVGIAPEDRAGLLERGAALVACPGSNRFLFGRTAEVTEFARAGRLAIGSDSRLSGEPDVLQELKVARATLGLDAPALTRAVTTDAASILRLPAAGRLRAGGHADLFVLRSHHACPFEALLNAQRSDIALTMIAGEPRIGDPSMAEAFAAAGVRHSRACLDGHARLIDRRLAVRLSRSTLQEPGLTLIPT